MSELSDLLTEANREPQLSTRAIQEKARKAGHSLGHDTAAKWLRGEHPRRPSEAKLRAWHAVFPSLTLPELREAARVAPTPTEIRLPAEASRLTPRQAGAVRELILSILYPEERFAYEPPTVGEVKDSGTPIETQDEDPIGHKKAAKAVYRKAKARKGERQDDLGAEA